MSNQDFFEKQLKDKINSNITYAEYKQTQNNYNLNQYYINQQFINKNKQLEEEKKLEEQLKEQRKNIDKETESKWERYKSRKNSYYDGPKLLMAVKEHGQPYKNSCNIS